MDLERNLDSYLEAGDFLGDLMGLKTSGRK